MNKTLIKDALILALITVIAGTLLGGVYMLTKEPVSRQKQITKEKAYAKVFEVADSFEEVKDFDSEKATNSIDQEAFPKEEYSIDALVNALDKQGQLLGYVITVTTQNGYGGAVTLVMGVKLDGTVNGIDFLTLNETAGLGMKAKEIDFMKQFKNKNVPVFTYTKSGATEDAEIDAISGATITTKAVTYAVDAGLDYFRVLTQGGAQNES